ncbi:hypothetical protein HID58_059349 [Brassica napus]|uniref:Uncharacterized protein n=1 Tax=Brassica napus TaxID=3708 RepID=A0ABQ7ZT72_BRANA|nr:hypothetical protein HID58_059349 [Brassica napus]
MDSDEVDSIQLQTLHPYHPGKILSIKEAFVTLTIYLEPKVHYLTEKSIEVLSMSKQDFVPLCTQNTYNPIHEPNYDHSETTLGESTSCLRAIYQKRHSFDWFPSHIHHQIAFCSLQSNSPKGKKRYSHKQEPSIGYRRGKPASITINHLPPRISLGLY